MRTPRAWIGKLADLISRGRRERELAAELEAHIELHAADNRRAGMSPDDARRAALLKLGGVEPTREAMRDVRSLPWADTLVQDVRYAFRSLRRAPVFTGAALVSLALGLASAVAIFTVADSLLLRQPPYRDPAQLVALIEPKRADAAEAAKQTALSNVSPGNYLDWKTQGADIFESMGGFRENRTAVLVVGSRVEEIKRLLVTADLLPTLGVQPIRGRLFTADEDRPGVVGPVVISHRLWMDWFGGDERIIGRAVQINAAPRTIAGVLPPGFYFRDRAIDLWEPIGLNPSLDYRKIEGRWLRCVARLRPGVTLAQAQARMTAIAARSEAAYPDFNRDRTVAVLPLRQTIVGDIQTPLLILLGAVGLLLAVSCANVAGLVLARAESRRRELAVRASLGAGRWRVVRLLLTESIVLGVVAGCAALLLTRVLVAALLAAAPTALLRGAEAHVDWRIALFGMILSVSTAVLFGLAPALIATGRRLVHPLRDDTRTTTGGQGAARAWLVSAEVALTVILLVGAGLLFRTLAGLHALNPGLDASNVLTLRVSLPMARYPEVPTRTQFFARAIDEIGQLPGVRSPGAINALPFVGSPAGTVVNVEGEPPARPGEERFAVIRTVMPGYFRTMGIPLREGREFIASDTETSAPIRFVISESLARRFLGGRSPLSTRISVSMNPANPYGEVVGVAGDVNEGALDKPPAPTVYYIYPHLAYTNMTLVVRTQGDPLTLVGEIRRTIARLDPLQPIAEVMTMEEAVGTTVARQRFSAALLSAFSLLSLVLACVGIYGVLAYTVSRRTREIGVRIALGAQPGRIVWLIVRAGVRMVGIGLVVGLAGALALSRLVETLLYGVGPRDLPTFAVVTTVLATVALAAAAVPAFRAARLDPTRALRAD